MKIARQRLLLAAGAIIFAGALIVAPARAIPAVQAAPSGQSTPSAQSTPSGQTASSGQTTPTEQKKVTPELNPPEHEKTMRAEEAEVEKGPDPLHTPAGKALRWVNFFILIGAIGYFVWKNGGPAFRARANEIAAGITSATAAKAEADAQLRVAEAGLARLDQDTAAMRGEAREEFAAESERLRAAGQQDVERIEAAAEAEIIAARRAAQIELRAMAARLAAARATEMVPVQITAAQRAALVKQFVEELPAISDGRGAN